MMATPTTQSLDLLRKLGFLPAVVESWVPKIERRRDLWGFGDILACHPRDRLFLIVQATSMGNVSARLNKARSKGALALWLRAGGEFEVWGWGPSGVKRVAVQAGDLRTAILEQPARRGKKPAGLFDGIG
jgi:hypothetical protein